MVEPLELRHFEMKEYLPKNLEFRERPMMDHAQELKYKQRPMMEHYDADPLGLKNRTK